MISKTLLEQRAARVAQMAEKLGIQLAPGSEARHELRSTRILGSCLSCRHEGACCAFTDGDDLALGAPSFCLNKETFDRLLAAEHLNPTLSQSEIDELMLLASEISFTGDLVIPLSPLSIEPVDDCGRVQP